MPHRNKKQHENKTLSISWQDPRQGKQEDGSQ